MTNESDDNEAYPRLAMPLWRRWSARLAEAQEVLVRFQGVARRAGRRMRRRCGIASVARMQSSRFLPGSVLVQVQPEARSRVRPTGEAAVFQAVPGEFDSHRPLDARAVQRLNAGPTRRRSLVRSQPCVPTNTSCSSRGKEPGFSFRENTGSTPVHDTSRMTPSSNGSGSEFTNLRTVVRVHPESLLGRDLGSRWFPSPISGVRFLDGLRPRQAAHLVVGSVSYAGRAGFDPLACYQERRTAGNSPGGEGSPTHCMRRVRSPGSLQPFR